MQMHAEPHKKGLGSTVLNIDIIFLIFFKLINNHGSCKTMSKTKNKASSLIIKQTQCRKTKYSPKVYNNMLLLRSAAGTSTLYPTSKSFSDAISRYK